MAMSSSTGKYVLVVDDDPGVRRLLVETLARDPRWCVLEARDGDEALEVARRQRPALILLDIVMPKKDGVQVFRELRTNPETADVKVVFLTALPFGCKKLNELPAGAEALFTKPFSPMRLIRKVEELLSLD